jgi:SAM-dependent methyltransferase
MTAGDRSRDRLLPRPLLQVRPLVLAKGAATFIPGVVRLACGRSYGTDSPRYCYSVWLRHVVAMAHCGIETDFGTVAELGPGDSLGIGLAAILTGASRYFAFDAMPHARPRANRETLDVLARLFAARTPIPGGDELPEITPHVASLEFPRALLEARLASPRRLEAIRAALGGEADDAVSIRYAAPWHDSALVEAESVDLVISQAVLEHVDDLDATYGALARWLRPGAVMSHAIDLRSHGLTRDWYGHWTVPDPLWRVVRGRRPYLINRAGASEHLRRMERAGFEIIRLQRTPDAPASRGSLARSFRDLPDEDLATAGCFVIARKRGP